jgi:flagellar biogenesis protein FliO
MLSERKQKELSQLSPEAIEAKRKQRSLNRIFGLLLVIALILFAMLVYELILILF